MRRGLKRLLQDCRGNIAVEFALVTPVFILILMAVADYGSAMTARADLDAAARAGLQVLLRDVTDTAGATSAVLAQAPEADVNTSVACVCTNGTAVACAGGHCPTGVPRRTATIAVTRSYALLVPWPHFENPLPLQATAVGRLQ